MKKRLQKFCVKWEEFNSSKQCAEYKSASGITLIALIVTMVFRYDKLKKVSNINGFLLINN